MQYIWLSIGSNLCNPIIQIKKALHSLDALPLTELVNHSSCYRSKPLGNISQPDFLNLVAVFKSRLSPEIFLKYINKIEVKQGRKRNNSNRWGPRTIDIDIVLFGKLNIITPNLIIPHYNMNDRDFVLYPILEIDKNLKLPNGNLVLSLTKKVKNRLFRIYERKNFNIKT